MIEDLTHTLAIELLGGCTVIAIWNGFAAKPDENRTSLLQSLFILTMALLVCHGILTCNR